MTKLLNDVQTTLNLTELNSFQLFQLQSMLKLAVPEVQVDVTGTLNLSTNKAFYIFKERQKLNFPTTISPKTIKILEYKVLQTDSFDIPNFNLLSFFRQKIDLLQIDSYVASFISTLNYFKFTTKEIISIFLSILDYESRGFSQLVGYKRGVRVPSTIHHQTYQPKGLIKLYGENEYQEFTQLSNLVDLISFPQSLSRLCIAFYYSCLYYKHYNLHKYSQELDFRSVVRHFDCTYDSWKPRFTNWTHTHNLLNA